MAGTVDEEFSKPVMKHMELSCWSGTAIVILKACNVSAAFAQTVEA